MQVLTYYQPHATLSAIGAKTVETRGMDTKHRGWTAIHAATNTPSDYRELAEIDPFKRVLEGCLPWYKGFASLPAGAIIGVYWLACVTDAVRAAYGWRARDQVTLPGEMADYDDVPKYEVAFGDYSVGRKAWWTTRIYPLPEPIPCRGLPGLWSSRLLHEGFHHASEGTRIDPTELEVRRQMREAYSIDLDTHAMDDPAMWRLVNRRGLLGSGTQAGTGPDTRVESTHDQTSVSGAAAGAGDPGAGVRGA